MLRSAKCANFSKLFSSLKLFARSTSWTNYLFFLLFSFFSFPLLPLFAVGSLGVVVVFLCSLQFRIYEKMERDLGSYHEYSACTMVSISVHSLAKVLLARRPMYIEPVCEGANFFYLIARCLKFRETQKKNRLLAVKLLFLRMTNY